MELKNVLKDSLPFPPSRSRFRKFYLYCDANEFKEIDEHAIAVSQRNHDTFGDLIHDLIVRPGLRSELDKARAIFRWMTARNMYTLSFRNYEKGRGLPEETLEAFKNKKGTYARIFETMCGYSGVYAVVITGFAKGMNYRPGDVFKGTEYNHSWNAVLIQENWHLVDSHWATRYLVSEKNQPENLVYEYDDFYFLTDPEQLIYSHWAQKPEWQLLHSSLRLEEFQDLPLVKSYFFKCGMYFQTHQTGVVRTNNGRLSLAVGFIKPTNFSYKIVSADTGEEIYKGHKLKSYALQLTGNGKVAFLFRSPKPGAYYFTIFAQLLTGDLGIKNVFTASAEYKVIADRASSDASPMPVCSDSNWGPSVPVDQLGLVPTQRDPVVMTSDGRVQLSFIKTRPANILCRLRRSGMKPDELERCVSERDDGDRLTVTANLPTEGEYGLEIYGNDPSKDGDTYTHICQYFVHYAPTNEQNQAFYQDSPERRLIYASPTASVNTGRYAPGTAELVDGVSNLQLNDNDEGFPPPPAEVLQQQYLYGTVPNTTQQPLLGNMAHSRGQGHIEYRPGTGQTVTKPVQQAALINIPSSKPIQVEKRQVGYVPPPPPPNFQLQPVKMQNESAPAPAPAPAQKPTLDTMDNKVLQSVDDHAIQVSKSTHNSFKDLVWDLIYAKNITNELEKVRVIFRWLASKNLKEMNFEHVEPGSPEEILMGLKTGRTTYAMVFETLCNYAGLHGQILSGYAKGADYRPGQKFVQGTNQHSWNAVYIYGQWCLIDCHWAARRIIGKQSTAEEDFLYQLDEYFFLTNPHQLKYTHFPDNPKWQLLERPIRLEEFENQPHMKPQFFKYDLELVSHTTAVIESRGETTIRLAYPSKKRPLAFNFSIQFESGEEEFRGTKLNRYGMQESSSSIASFRLRLPKAGSYVLYIYAKEDTPENKENLYAQVCEYKILQERLSCEPAPFPPCSYLSWGTGSAFQKYNLSTYQQKATIKTQAGKAELQIQRPPNVTRQFMAKLKHNSMSDDELEGYILTRTVGSTEYFTISLPQRGEYGLELYANDPTSEGMTLYHVGQFLIECNEDVYAIQLPKLPTGYLGPQPKFSESGMETLSHNDKVIYLDCNHVEIQLTTQQPMRVTANLISVKDETEYQDLVFTQSQGSVVSFIVCMPETGFYKLQLYAVACNDKSQQLPGIYNYLIHVKKVTSTVCPFPKQYAQWKEGCYMWEPMAISPNMDRSKPLHFRVSIPAASSVAAVADEDWTLLEQTNRGWEGDVSVGKLLGTGAKLTLNASMGHDKNSYATLLEYTL